MEYEQFISLDRAVEYKVDVRPYANPEDKFVEYEWPKDEKLIDYLVRQGDISLKNVVFKRIQNPFIIINMENPTTYLRKRPQYQELEI